MMTMQNPMKITCSVCLMGFFTIRGQLCVLKMSSRVKLIIIYTLLWIRSAVLLPIVITGYVTYWFVEFFDNFFSPLYEYLLGIHVFGLGFITSLLFIFVTGVFTSVSDITMESF